MRYHCYKALSSASPGKNIAKAEVARSMNSAAPSREIYEIKRQGFLENSRIPSARLFRGESGGRVKRRVQR
jgi:hypothetical protein